MFLDSKSSPQVLSSGAQDVVVSPCSSSLGGQAESSASQLVHPSVLYPGQAAASPHQSPVQPASSPGQAARSGPEPEPAGSPRGRPSSPPGAHAAKAPRHPTKRGRGARSGRGRRRAGRAGRGAVDRDTLLAEGHPLAPPNDTDFLMDDHDDQPESDLLFDRYGQPTPRESPAGPHGGWTAPAGLVGWPLLEPSIARLIAEHIQMESHIEALEARIALVRQRRDSASDASDEEMQQGEVRMAPETATKIRVLETEIRRLEEENAALREFNERIIDERGGGSVESFTSDSESDSSSSSSGSSASSHSSSSSSDSSSSGSESAPGSPPVSPRMPASV